MKELIPATLEGERVDRVVAAFTDLPRATIAKMVDRGAVRLNGKPAKSRGFKVVEGQTLEIDIPEPEDDIPFAESGIQFKVIYKDDAVIVVDKPAGLVVHPGNGHQTGTMVNGLLERFPDIAETLPGDVSRPGIVHRLDAGTSGLLAVARTQDAYNKLVSALKARTVERRYLTLVWGDVQPDRGVVDAPIGRAQSDRTKMSVSATGRTARTRYEVLQRGEDPSVSLVAAQLETGRTHQIRVHLAAIGHPVVSDKRYNGIRQGIQLSRPFLHARSLRFKHPVTDEEVYFESPLPEDLLKVLKKLGLEGAAK